MVQVTALPGSVLAAIVTLLLSEFSKITATSPWVSFFLALAGFVLAYFHISNNPLPGTTTTTPGAGSTTTTTTTSTPAPAAISYTVGGQTVYVTPNEAAGTKDPNGFTVGQQNAVAFTSAQGTLIPAGAVYLGLNEWELAGNYYE